MILGPTQAERLGMRALSEQLMSDVATLTRNVATTQVLAGYPAPEDWQTISDDTPCQFAQARGAGRFKTTDLDVYSMNATLIVPHDTDVKRGDIVASVVSIFGDELLTAPQRIVDVVVTESDLVCPLEGVA
jgi:hypothetical protein